MKDELTIFLCYARSDRPRVEKLYTDLANSGFKPWMDTRDILPGEKWPNSIHRAISCSDFFVACLSKKSINKRGFLQKEIKQALSIWQEKLEDDIYLIPICLEKCELPEPLKCFQRANLFEKDGFEEIVNAIRNGARRLYGWKQPHLKTSSIQTQSVEAEEIASKTERMEACDLFGGREVIMQKMTTHVRKWLEGLSTAESTWIEKMLNLPKGTFEGILLQHQPVDTQIYSKIKEISKEISKVPLSECLGTPSIDEAQRQLWEKEFVEHPIRLAAAVSSVDTTSDKKRAGVIDLQMYVTLRAIGELYTS